MCREIVCSTIIRESAHIMWILRKYYYECITHLANFHELLPWNHPLVTLGRVQWVRGILDNHLQMGQAITDLRGEGMYSVGSEGRGNVQCRI